MIRARARLLPWGTDAAVRRVVARLSAWGDDGPWGGRRGFDSLVQVATGIAAVEADAGSASEDSPESSGGARPGGTPGALPAQALDHGTGYLLAAAVLRALTEQSRTGGSFLATLALARTARWLLDDLTDDGERPSGPERPGPRPETSGPRPETPGAGAYDPARHLGETDSTLGRLRHALPPVSFDGAPATWTTPPGRCGTDAPVWR